VTANFSYLQAGSLDEAVRHLGDDGARLYAGGSDLLGCLRDDVFVCSKVVSISGLEHLRRIREIGRGQFGGGLGIGALVTIAEIAQDRHIREQYSALAEAASVVASPQLRQQGTVGGNLCQKPRCWYYRGEFACLRKGGDDCFAIAGQNQYHAVFGGDVCVYVHPSDCAPALIALGATVGIKSRRDDRTVPLEQFYVSPADDPTRETVLARDEIVTEILLPKPSRATRSRYRKVRTRGSWDFALAAVALNVTFADRDNRAEIRSARVVLGGVAPVPWRVRAAEQELEGRRLDEATARDAARAATEGADDLEHNGYKIPLVEGLIEAELMALVE
jgi:xanthine dehydrogenase YagS FAD-binding subunit